MEIFHPYMTGPDGLLTAIQPAVGLKRGARIGSWSSLQSSGMRTGTGLVLAWDILQSEANNLSKLLDTELTEVLAKDFDDFGEGSEDGSTNFVIPTK